MQVYVKNLLAWHLTTSSFAAFEMAMNTFLASLYLTWKTKGCFSQWHVNLNNNDGVLPCGFCIREWDKYTLISETFHVVYHGNLLLIGQKLFLYVKLQ